MAKEIEGLVERVLKGLGALPEDRMRLDLLGRTLKRLGPDEIALFLDALYSKRTAKDSSVKARSILVDPRGIKAAIGDEKYKSVYLASIRLGLDRVSRLFTDLPPHKKGLAGYGEEEDARMEHITLGERRTLSKGSVKDVLDRLLSDPDPVVITNILNNPRITEKEVLKIASRRPNSPEILRILSGHRKWSKRYPVIKAVVLNPYTAPRIAIALLELMMAQDLRLVSEDKTLHPQVRVSAKETYREKTGKGGG